jgi:hypothetical protein
MKASNPQSQNPKLKGPPFQTALIITNRLLVDNSFIPDLVF